MANGICYTQKDVDDLVTIYNQGATVEEIAEMTGRSVSAIRSKLNRLGLSSAQKGADTNESNVKEEAAVVKTPAPVKEKTLQDFTIREIIYHLYHDRSCRFRVRENNRVVVVVEKEINISDILKGN